MINHDDQSQFFQYPNESCPMKVVAGEADIGALIGGLPSLSGLSGPAWANALAASGVVRQRAGGDMSMCRDHADHLSLVLKGSIKIRAHSEDGRIFNVLHVRAGEMCLLSLAIMFGARQLSSDVVAEDDTVILRIPRHHLDRLLVELPEFRTRLLTSMSGCFIKMLDLVEEIAFTRLQSRIVNHLLTRTAAIGSPGLRITHQELACELGSTREVISRLLKTLEKNGEIKLGRGLITVLQSSSWPGGNPGTGAAGLGPNQRLWA